MAFIKFGKNEGTLDFSPKSVVKKGLHKVREKMKGLRTFKKSPFLQWSFLKSAKKQRTSDFLPKSVLNKGIFLQRTFIKSEINEGTSDFSQKSLVKKVFNKVGKTMKGLQTFQLS